MAGHDSTARHRLSLYGWKEGAIGFIITASQRHNPMAEYADKPSPSGASDEKSQFVSEGTTHEVSSFGATTWFTELPLDGGKGTITDIFSRFLYSR